MTLNLQNIEETKKKLNGCDISKFDNSGNSFRRFLKNIDVTSFRHIENLKITFNHPITVIAGTNKIGKTSILLLIACSFERFLKADSTSPTGEVRPHQWKDVITFTSHENADKDYLYNMSWRVGDANYDGTGKRLASKNAWSGLGKKSSDTKRINAKIRNREVRLVDLERILPGRSFSNALQRKANAADKVRMNKEIEQAFSYVFDREDVELYEAGNHINKKCFLISESSSSYSSFNAASGEEAVIYLLKDLIESPKDSLILIDEIEAGFHPSIQRKLADIVQYISWRDKKQFIITTHSPTLLSSFPCQSRKFIERMDESEYKVINNISHQAARSKMDSLGHPLLILYCEDDIASFLVQKILVEISREKKYFERVVNIVTSGPANEVENDYKRHKRNFTQLTNKIGYCAVLDGDKKDDKDYSSYFDNPDEYVAFIYPYKAPEKFLVQSFLTTNHNNELASALKYSDHHSLFQKMVNLSLATDELDARNQCYDTFKNTPEYSKHSSKLQGFLISVATKFSEMQD